MDRNTQNKINNFDTMRDVLADPDNQAAIDSNQGFKDEAEGFRDTRAIMQPFIIAAGDDTRGVTVNKQRVREALVKKVVKLTGGGFAYARKIRHAQLETDMDNNQSHWKKMAGGVLETAAQIVHDKLEPIVTADAATAPPPATPIANYQVTAAALTDLQTAIDSLSLVEHGPRSKQGTIGSASKQVATLVEELDEKKKTLKRLLPQLEESYPQFVNAMRTAMTIVDRAATHASPTTPPAPAGGGSAPATP